MASPWPTLPKAAYVPIVGTDYGYVQKSRYRQEDLYDEEVVDLEDIESCLVPVSVQSGTQVFTFLLLGDQNAGKSTFLHAFTYDMDRNFMRLASVLPILSSNFLNVRLRSTLHATQQTAPIDELPFLDTDIGRCSVLLTRENFDFFLEEFQIPGELYPMDADTRFVSIQFIEVGGDHLDLLMLPSDEKNHQDEVWDIRQRSWSLLQSAQKTMYFINCQCLFIHGNKGTLFAEDTLKTLLARVAFLSCRLFPTGHQFVFVLSRLPSSSSPTTTTTSTTTTTTASTTTTTTSTTSTATTATTTANEKPRKMEDDFVASSSTASPTSSPLLTEFDLHSISDQLMQLAIHHRHTFTSSSFSSSSSSSTATGSTSPSSFVADCKTLQNETGDGGLSADIVILAALRWMSQELQWPCVIARVQRADHLAGNDINAKGVLDTLSCMFREVLSYSSGSATALTARHLIKCYRGALSQSVEGFAPFVDNKAFARYLNQVEFTEVPKHTLQQLFPSVIRSLGRVDLCLLDSPPFYVVFRRHDENNNESFWQWSLPHSTSPPSAARFPLHPQFLDLIESICNKPVPSLSPHDAITVGKLTSEEMKQLKSCAEVIAQGIKSQFQEMVSLLGSPVHIHLGNQSHRVQIQDHRITLQEQALQGIAGHAAKLFWVCADLCLALRLLHHQNEAPSRVYVDNSTAQFACNSSFLTLQCPSTLWSDLKSMLSLTCVAHGQQHPTYPPISDFSILSTALQIDAN